MSFRDTSRRLRVAGLLSLVAAGLVAATAVGAQAPSGGATVYTHSAASGELRGGRLILHQVSGRVTWATSSGRSGAVSVKRLHRRMFRRATPAATGTLHIAGYHGGDEPTFRLSKPRYNRARRTVSYRAKPLDKKPLPSASVAAAGAARRFGAASLSIIGAPQAIGGGDVPVCKTTLTNNTPYDLDGGTATTLGVWTLKPPLEIESGGSASWSAHGTDPLDTCFNKATWDYQDIEIEVGTSTGDPARGTCFPETRDVTSVVCRQLAPPKNDPNGLYWSLED